MKNPPAPLLASVIICTRNRAAYLRRTIHEAAAQSFSTGRFEILVVDNGSTDNTPEVVRECQSAIKSVSLRYVVENEVGLSAARNRAIQEAKGEILCFLDDDAVPEPEWLERLVRAYDANPIAMSVGGDVVPVYESELPEWFAGNFEFIFKPKIQRTELHRVFYPYYPYGVNFSIRATVVSQIGAFNTNLGYKGQNLIPCEETEFLLRIEKAGHEILMEPSAVVNHLIPASRLTRNYLLRLYYAHGRGYATMNELHQTKSEKRETLFRLFAKLPALYSRNVWLRIKFWRQYLQCWRTLQPDIYYKQFCLANSLGISDQELIIQWNHLWNK